MACEVARVFGKWPHEWDALPEDQRVRTAIYVYGVMRTREQARVEQVKREVELAKAAAQTKAPKVASRRMPRRR